MRWAIGEMTLIWWETGAMPPLALVGAAAGHGALQERRIRGVWMLAYEQAQGRQGRGGEQEGRIAFGIARQIKQAGSSYKWMRKNRGDADESACAGILYFVKISNSIPLNIENTLSAPRLSNRRLVGYTRDICA